MDRQVRPRFGQYRVLEHSEARDDVDSLVVQAVYQSVEIADHDPHRAVPARLRALTE